MKFFLRYFILILFAIGLLSQQVKSINNEVEIGSLLQAPAMKELVYKTVEGEHLRMFWIAPDDSKKGLKRTAVIWIHGGGWTGGITETFFPHARYFASRGAVGFCIDYRLLKVDGNATVADCVADCKSAIRYIRQHAEEFGIDPDKVIVMGDSAGGHLASCMGTLEGFDDPLDDFKFSAYPNAMVLYNPLSDFTSSVFINRIIGGKALEKKPTPESQVPTADQIELAKKLSPLYNVHKNQAPCLILHGLDDKVIFPGQSEKFNDAMKQVGNNCSLILLPNTSHAFVCANYKSSEEEVVNAIREGDKFLTSLGFLKGQPSLIVSRIPAWTPKLQRK